MDHKYVSIVENNIVRLDVPERFDLDAIKCAYSEMVEVYEHIGGPIRLISDISKPQELPKTDERAQMVKCMKAFGPCIEKSVGIGLNSIQRIAANMTLMLAGRENVKLMDNEEEPLAWLKE